MTDRPAVGIRRKRDGWQAYIKLKGRLVSKQFPFETGLATMKRWRHDQRARSQLNLPLSTKDGTFGADCVAYLKAVAGLPTISDRTYRIKEWQKVFGDRPRGELTPLDIQSQLEQWRKNGMSPGTLRLRRSALSHLFTTLDRGTTKINPVKSVPNYRVSTPPLVLPTLAQAIKAVAAAKDSRSKRPDGKDAARLAVLLWTGWPAKLLTQLTEADVDWKAGTAIVHGRWKGQGTRPRRLPLLPQALTALRALRDADAFGPFDNHNLRRALRRGCLVAKVRPFTTYTLRHLFGTTVAVTAKDDRVVAELLMHSDVRQTQRYTEASVNPRVLAGLKQVTAALTPRATRKAAGNLSPAGQPTQSPQGASRRRVSSLASARVPRGTGQKTHKRAV